MRVFEDISAAVVFEGLLMRHVRKKQIEGLFPTIKPHAVVSRFVQRNGLHQSVCDG